MKKTCFSVEPINTDKHSNPTLVVLSFTLRKTENQLIISNVHMLGLISGSCFSNVDLMDWYLEKGYSIHK